ncbi:enoyl-CoA hydratase/isomerase family protein [Nonomuraea ferruginea]
MIDITVRDEVAVITLNRPEKLNALTEGMRRDLAAAVRAHGDGSARGIVVTGTGRAFSSGEDINQAVDRSLLDEVELFHDLTRAVLEARVPVVAAVNGLSVGGAAEWTLCFDARVGTPRRRVLLAGEPHRPVGLQRVEPAAEPPRRRRAGAPAGAGLVPDQRGGGTAARHPR